MSYLEPSREWVKYHISSPWRNLQSQAWHSTAPRDSYTLTEQHPTVTSGPRRMAPSEGEKMQSLDGKITVVKRGRWCDLPGGHGTTYRRQWSSPHISGRATSSACKWKSPRSAPKSTVTNPISAKAFPGTDRSPPSSAAALGTVRDRRVPGQEEQPHRQAPAHAEHRGPEATYGPGASVPPPHSSQPS